MDAISTPVAALHKAIDLTGSQSAFAELIGLTQQAVSKMVKELRPLAAEHVLAVEAATGVSRHELRPDIYPLEKTQSSGAGSGGTPAEGSLSPSAGAGDPLQGLQA